MSKLRFVQIEEDFSLGCVTSELATDGCASGPVRGGLIPDSGSVGVISAPASFTALKIVPGGVCGGPQSTIRLV